MANIQEELEASIRAHEDQINNLSAELGSIRLNSTSSSVQQQFLFARSSEATTGFHLGRPNAARMIPKMAAKEITTSFPSQPAAPSQFASFALAQPSQPQGVSSLPATSNPTQVMSLLHQLSKILAHLSHLMDLASRFQWPAVKNILKT